MIDSLYYVKLSGLGKFLGRCTEMLRVDGLLLIRLHDLERHNVYLQALSRLYQVERLAGNLFCIARSPAGSSDVFQKTFISSEPEPKP